MKFNYLFLTGKSVFTVTVIITILTVLSICFTGLGQQRTLFENTMLTLSVLSVFFFLFVTTGLYKGIKIKDNTGNIKDKLNSSEFPNLSDAVSNSSSGFIEIGDGIEGIVLSLILWILVSFFLIIFIWFFGFVLWTGIVFFVAMLYWIFFRAVRLVFKNSNKCKGNLFKCVRFGLGYTLLYISWIYGIVLTIHFSKYKLCI